MIDSSRKIRVVVGEDSPFMQRLIVDTLNGDPAIEVVGTASNGREALRKTVELKPDCVTLDLEMPRMNGLETLRYPRQSSQPASRLQSLRTWGRRDWHSVLPRTG